MFLSYSTTQMDKVDGWCVPWGSWMDEVGAQFLVEAFIILKQHYVNFLKKQLHKSTFLKWMKLNTEAEKNPS